MNETSTIVSLLNIASKVDTPMAVIGLVMALFFIFMSQIIKRLPAHKIQGNKVATLIIIVSTYGFIFSLVVVIVAAILYVFTEYVGPSYIQSEIESSLERSDYANVILKGELFLEDHPKNDNVRHMLGTSYFHLRQYDNGINLYKDMDMIYKNHDVCSEKRSASLSSLAAFHLVKEEAENAYIYSEMTLNCDNNTDPFIFNHMKILTMLGGHDIGVLPNGYIFSNSYWESKHSFLQFINMLNSDHDIVLMDNLDHLINAYCEDDDIKIIIINRFNNGDISDSTITSHNFDYEMAVLEKHINDDDRRSIEAHLNDVSCVV